uniref:Uncharacterized protein n=1 Tax=Caenorhabditis japonica TaxID=281687 RepID=A0A8R1ERH8_CAEJA
MVSVRRRPLWITRIKSRVSLNTFKKQAPKLVKEQEDVCRVLKGKSQKFVYKVEVEMMEGLEDDSCLEDIWVPDSLVEPIEDLFQEFFEEDQENSFEEPSPNEDEDHSPELTASEEHEYQQLCDAEPFDPYSHSDHEDVEDDVSELPQDENTAENCAETTA